MSELSISSKSGENLLSSGNPLPSKLFAEVTTKCNLKCGMCVKQNGDGGVSEGTMSVETFRALEPAFPNLEALILNGIGEPLLHPHLEEFIRTAKGDMPEKAWVGFQSNGMLMTQERALRLVGAGLDRICLSVDSISGDSFRKIREGGEMRDIQRAFDAFNDAKKAVGRMVDLGIEFVLMRENLFELPDAVRWASRQGASFALVTQLLPYNKSLVGQSVYDTNTRRAIEVYKRWKRKAEDEGLDTQNYFATFMKYFKEPEEERLFILMEQMKADAFSQGIALQMGRLLNRDEEWFASVEAVFEEVREIASEEGIAVTLPESVPKNKRTCEFVESDSAFVSWDGNVHPCYFLWHRYRCYVGGWEKEVTPRVFGSLSEHDIFEIWNAPEFVKFRQSVLRYDFPFCFDCSFALCDLAQRADFEQDCYTNRVPCGACLWCTGLFHCLQ